MNLSSPCNNITVANGHCYGMPVCGYCYDMGLHRHASPPYELYNLFVIGMILPLLETFGIFGNTISAFIYSRKSMKSSINTYLCALAFSDITVITTAFFLFFLESMRKRSAFASRYFALFAPVTFPLGLTAQSMSVFLTIAGAFDCFILVIGSDSAKERICNPRIAKRVIGTVFVLAIIFNLSHWFEIYVLHCWSIPYSEPTFDVCPTSLRMSQTYFTFYYAYMYTIVMAVGPVILLLIINSCIVIILKNPCPRSNSNNGNASSMVQQSDIITLVLVVCLFIACNILFVAMVQVLRNGKNEHCLYTPLTVNFLELFFGIENTYLIDLSNLMVVLNSSCNFLIYYAFGSQFRRTLKEYLKNFIGRKKTLKFSDEVIAINYTGDSEIKLEDALLL